MQPKPKGLAKLLDEGGRIWYPKTMAKKPTSKTGSGAKEKAVVSEKSYGSPSKSGRPSKGDLQIVGTALPVGYLRLLDEEAGQYSMGRREFLLLLHKRRKGEAIFERPASAPKPTLQAQELQQVRPYKWPLTAQERQSIDNERLHVGIPSIAMYIIVLLCDWLGLQVFSPSQAANVGVRDDTTS